MIRRATAPPLGFTLLEILVATTIFSVLIGALYSVLFGAMRLRETTFRNVEAGLPREMLVRTLRNDLTHMVVPAGILAGALTGTVEDQGGLRLDTITFYSTTGIVTDYEPWGEVQQVDYLLETPDDRDAALGLDLMRETTRNLLASTTEEATDEELVQWLLVRGVQSMELTYWDGEAWTDSWDSTTVENENPRAIRLRLTFVNAPDAERIEAPLELVCEIAPQPRPTPTTGTSASGGDSAAPTPTPQPTPPAGGGSTGGSGRPPTDGGGR